MTSNGIPNRHRAGTPVGGQFAEGQKAGADPSVSLEGQVPVDLQIGGDESFSGDGSTVLMYSVQRVGRDAYAASATVPAGTAAYLLGAEEIDEDSYDELMTSARWNAMTAFLEDRYGACISDGGEDDDLILDVNHDFDHAPTESEVINATWETVARIHNETDAGTFGVRFVGTELREHLDEQAFCQPYPFQMDDGRWLPAAPMGPDEAIRTVRETDDDVVSDRCAQALAHYLATFDGAAEYKQLARKGYADRSSLGEAALLVERQHSDIADALAKWALHQPTTTDLLDEAPRKRDAA